MDDIFKEYDFIHVYVDDMLISSKNHLKHLKQFIDLCIRMELDYLGRKQL